MKFARTPPLFYVPADPVVVNQHYPRRLRDSKTISTGFVKAVTVEKGGWCEGCHADVLVGVAAHRSRSWLYGVPVGVAALQKVVE